MGRLHALYYASASVARGCTGQAIQNLRPLVIGSSDLSHWHIVRSDGKKKPEDFSNATFPYD